MNHLEHLGFVVKDKEDFRLLLKFAVRQGKRYRNDKGFYVRYRDGSGAELWVQLDLQQRIVGVTPFFDGMALPTVCLTEKVPSKLSVLSGGFIAWAAPQKKDDPQSALYPFLFEAVNFQQVQLRYLPINYQVQLTAFPHEIQFFRNRGEYLEYQRQQPEPMASKAFLPVGYLEFGKVLPKGAYAWIAGEVLKSDVLFNYLTRKMYFHFFIQTLGMQMDVVCHPDYVPFRPDKGAVLNGLFWVGGKPLHPPF